MRKQNKDIRLTSYEDLLGLDAAGNELDKITEVPLEDLHEFKNHPFKVLDDQKMADTVDSIQLHGVLNPAIVRARAEGGYEIISGHRRKRACELAGKKTMPVLVRDYSDEEAIVIMVDSNIQREYLVPSEKAYAYRMKYEALKHQGIHNGGHTADELGAAAGESGRTVQRYIRLTELIPPLFELVDQKKISLVTSEILSFLLPEEQQLLVEVMEETRRFPSREQAARLKGNSKKEGLSKGIIYAVLGENDCRQGSVSFKKIHRYFPEDYTKEQMEEVVYALLEKWRREQEEGD